MTEKGPNNLRRGLAAVGFVGVLGAPLLRRLLSRKEKSKPLALDRIVDKDVLTQIQIFKQVFAKEGADFLGRVNAKVIGDPKQRTRGEYAQDAFLYSKAKNMSAKIQAKLGVIMPGLAAQESKYVADLKEKRTAAYGVWQITPKHLEFINTIRKQRGEKEFDYDEMNKMMKATDFFFYSMDNYFYSESCLPGIKFAEEYGLSDEQAENFGIYCMIAAYNNGPSRLKAVLNAFKEEYPPGKVKGNFTFNSLSFFHTITVWAEKNKNWLSEKHKLIDGYGKESSQYLLRVLAGAEFLGHDRLHSVLSEMKSSKIERTLDFESAEEFERLMYSAGEYGTSAAIGGAAAASAYIGRTLASEESIPRREAIKRALGLGIAGATVAAGSEYLVKNPPDFNNLKFSWWTKESGGNETKYSDGSIFSPRRVSNRFSVIGENVKFLDALVVPQTSTLPTRNYTSVVKPYLDRIISKFPPITEAKLSELDKAGFGAYTKAQEINDKWRLRGIGSGAVDTHINNMKYALVAKETNELLVSITEQFQTEVKKAGLPNGWFIRPVVNALTRTQDGTNKTLPNASKISAHTNGLAFDISDTRFDVGFEEGGVKYFTELSRLSENEKTNDEILRKLRQIWVKILNEYHNEGENGKALVTYEPKARHYHITTKVKS